MKDGISVAKRKVLHPGLSLQELCALLHSWGLLEAEMEMPKCELTGFAFRPEMTRAWENPHYTAIRFGCPAVRNEYARSCSAAGD